MITGVSSSQNTANINAGSQVSAMGKDVFLRLLTTQLANQDPLNPMQDKEFISQLAQFSSLEQMQTLNANMASFMTGQTIISTASMIGKNVSAFDPQTGEIISGKVESIRLGSDRFAIVVNDIEIPLGNITDIS